MLKCVWFKSHHLLCYDLYDILACWHICCNLARADPSSRISNEEFVDLWFTVPLTALHFDAAHVKFM